MCAWGGFLAAAVLLAVLIHGTREGTNSITITHVTIRDDELATILRDSVVAQVSDLHIRETGERERKLLERIREIDPDLLFLTGDYVSWGGDYTAAIRFLAGLRAKVGVWAVMGDYDYSFSRMSCLFCHEEGGGSPTRKHAVRFLKDSTDIAHLSNGDLTLMGFDGFRGHACATGKIYKAKPSPRNPTIVLSHSPLNYDLIAPENNVLVLAGDTHGGQVPLPKWLFSALGYTKNARFNEGYFQTGRKKMYVSRGVGTSHIPLRIFRPPEIVVFHFQK